jgi:autotransporter-associated beta strand protein
MTPVVRLGNGLLGATADWSADAAVPITLTGDAVTGGTIRAADAQGVPHNIAINGVIAGTGAITKTGGGMVTLANTNMYTGPTNINQGTLALGIGGAIATTPSLVMGGGTLATGGFTQAMNATSLKLTSSSAIDMTTGTPNALNLANSNSDTNPALAWTPGQLLSILHWTGTAGVGGTPGVNDQVIFGTNNTGLSASQLIQIHFAGFNGAKLLSTGEVVPLTVSTRKLGDFTLDGHVNAADVSAMLTALADLNVYRTSRGLTGEDVLNIGDLDGDAHVTNADLQGLLAYLIAGNGSGANAVPEPSAALMAIVGLAGLAVGGVRNRWRRVAIR